MEARQPYRVSVYVGLWRASHHTRRIRNAVTNIPRVNQSAQPLGHVQACVCVSVCVSECEFVYGFCSLIVCRRRRRVGALFDFSAWAWKASCEWERVCVCVCVCVSIRHNIWIRALCCKCNGIFRKSDKTKRALEMQIKSWQKKQYWKRKLLMSI